MKIIKILGVAAGIGFAGAATLAIINSGNSAETSADGTDETLRTRVYKINLRTFTEETEKIIPTLSTYGKSWKLVVANVSDNSASIKAEVPVLIFIDDLEIKAEYDTLKSETTVDIRSTARVGSNDLGENRRHVLQILKVLDEKFAR